MVSLEASVDCHPSGIVPAKHITAVFVMEVEMIGEDRQPLVILTELDSACKVRGTGSHDLVEHHSITVGGCEPSKHIEKGAEGDVQCVECRIVLRCMIMHQDYPTAHIKDWSSSAVFVPRIELVQVAWLELMLSDLEQDRSIDRWEHIEEQCTQSDGVCRHKHKLGDGSHGDYRKGSHCQERCTHAWLTCLN